MSIEQHKRPYQTPEIVDFGQMEELTKGNGFGGADFFIWGSTHENPCFSNCARS